MSKCEEWYLMLCVDDLPELLDNAEKIAEESERSGGLFASAVGSGCRWYVSLIKAAKNEGSALQRVRSFRAWRDNMFHCVDMMECSA